MENLRKVREIESELLAMPEYHSFCPPKDMPVDYSCASNSIYSVVQMLEAMNISLDTVT